MPQRPRRLALLGLLGCVLGCLCLLLTGHLTGHLTPWDSSVTDQSIVQQGTYSDLCPGWTIEALLAHDHAEVEWTSYLNKYGHRSVRAVCLDATQTPRAVLIWTIDDQDRFWIQYAVKDGEPLQPYDLLHILCQGLPKDPSPDAPSSS